MCVNFTTPYRARRGAAKFRKRYDSGKFAQYVMVQGKLIVSGQIVWHVAIYSMHGNFLGYI